MRSIYGIKSLTKIFKAIDEKANQNLDVDDFRWGLMDFGIQISKDEASELLSSFSKDGGNSVNFELFLDQFRVSILNIIQFYHFLIFVFIEKSAASE